LSAQNRTFSLASFSEERLPLGNTLGTLELS
jgi:hypothetical protein